MLVVGKCGMKFDFKRDILEQIPDTHGSFDLL